MTGTSAFYNLELLNNTSSTTFNAPFTTTGRFTAIVPNTRIELAAGATTTLSGTTVIAGDAGNEVWLHSNGTTSSQFGFDVGGAYSITYANVKNSHACNGSIINVINGTSTDNGNNTCWWFVPPQPILTIAHYRWRMDHESEVSAGYYSAEDTALTDRVYKGDRVRLRMLVSNSGNDPATNYNYRLEYSSGSCTLWNNLGPDDGWFPDYTQYVNEYASTTNSGGLSDPGGMIWSPGVFRSGSATTGTHTLGVSYYTEHEFTIGSTAISQPGTVYCFRLTNDGSVTNFIYAVQPQLTLINSTRPQSGGADLTPNGGGVPRGGGDQGGGGDGGTGGSGGGPPQGGGGQGGGGDL